MQQNARSKKELLEEISALKERVAFLEKRESDRIQTERLMKEKEARAQTALKESEEILRSMIKATRESLLLTDTEGTILMANRVLAERVGKSVRELIGTCQFDHFPPDVAKRRKEKFEELVKTKKAIHFEDLRPARSLEIFAYPIMNDEGRVTKIAIFAHDITQRKHLELERERLIAELRQALSRVKTLSGFLPICASCKKIRNDEGYWQQIEAYIRENTDADFSHGICPECAQKLYPEFYKKIGNR